MIASFNIKNSLRNFFGIKKNTRALGFSAKREDVLQIWKENAGRWHASGPPWRPSNGDVGIYKNLAGERLFGAVLVLGATPELRDLAARNCRNVYTVADMSRTMLEQMSGLMFFSGTKQEKWLEGDWCEISIPENSFDLIVGDMIWWVLSLKQQRIVRDRIAKWLKSDGLFVSRFRTRDAGQHTDPRQIFNYYYAERLKAPENQANFMRMLLSRIYNLTANGGQCRIDRDAARRTLLGLASETVDTHQKRFLEEAASPHSIIGTNWTAQTKAEIVGMLEESFQIMEEQQASDYESDNYPIFSMRKRV